MSDFGISVMKVELIALRPRYSAFFHYPQQVLAQKLIESKVEFDGPAIRTRTLILFEPF